MILVVSGFISFKSFSAISSANISFRSRRPFSAMLNKAVLSCRIFRLASSYSRPCRSKYLMILAAEVAVSPITNIACLAATNEE